MKRRLFIGAAVVLAVLGAWAVIFNLQGLRTERRTVDVEGVSSMQFGGAELTVVFDGRDELEIETTRRSMPWVMVRQTGPFLEIGWPDDADPRMFLPHPYPGDRLRFVLHASSLESLTAAGGAVLTIDGLKAETFKLTAMSGEDTALRGVDVDRLEVEMMGDGDVVAEGRADSLYVMNSSAGDFDGSRLSVNDAQVLPGGAGITSVRRGSRVETFTGPR